MSKLSSTTASSVMQHIKSILARYGIPETLSLTMAHNFCQLPLPSLQWTMDFTIRPVVLISYLQSNG